MASSLPTFSHVQQASKILEGVAYRTPVLRSSFLDDQCGGTVFLKCESFQRTGAFKFRGAYHALTCKESSAPFHQVVTVSSGNHAQGLALASQLLGYLAHIVMPEPVNVFKRTRVEEWGATVTVAPTRQDAQGFGKFFYRGIKKAFPRFDGRPLQNGPKCGFFVKVCKGLMEIFLHDRLQLGCINVSLLMADLVATARRGALISWPADL